MTAIEDARTEAEQRHARGELYDLSKSRLTTFVEGAAWAIERLTAPPSDDERETLSAFIDRDLAWAEGDPDKLAQALIERFPGFRRQGPITDEQVEAAIRGFDAAPDSIPDEMPQEATRRYFRAALEAARDAS
jgi:hypothetical protein